MASHFKQPDESPRPRRRGGASRRSDGAGDVGFIPVMSEPSGERGGHDRRRREAHFVETDPYDLSGRRSRDSRKRAGRIVSVLLFVVGVALVVAAAGMWLHSQWQYHEQDEMNERLAAFAVVSDDGSSAPEVDWDALKAVNDEVVGWIQIPGTVVNFPVYQASDNEKYLHTNAEGVYSVGGQVFLDADNAAPGMIDDQTIVYGHHLRNGAMFKPISDMENQEMFDGVSTVWYVTEDATYELEPLLLYHTEATDENVRQFNFASDDGLRDYLAGLLDRAVAKRSDALEAIEGARAALSLCTCNYTSGDSGRTLLVCVPKASSDSAEAPSE